MALTVTFTRLDDVAWDGWTPRDRATLVFVVRDGDILLIRKKRGLGAGKINGPGGKIDPGETPAECAVREVQEEVCVTPTGLRECGELSFQFCDGYSMHVTVFSATDCKGEPGETPEATPLWCPLDAIPYERMWQDDRAWLPHLLAGQRFTGRFLFDGDRMVDYTLQTDDERASPPS